MNIYQKWMDWFRSKPRWMQASMIIGICVLLIVGLWLSSTSVGNQPAGDMLSSSAWMMGAFLKFVLVLGLIYGAAIIFKRSMNSSVRSSIRKMQVQETLNLTPKRSLHIVEIEGQVLLIGATDQGINLISEIPPKPTKNQFQALLDNAIAENSEGLEK